MKKTLQTLMTDEHLKCKSVFGHACREAGPSKLPDGIRKPKQNTSSEHANLPLPPPVARETYHEHATHSSVVVKDLRITLRKISETEIKLWTKPKVSTRRIPQVKKYVKPSSTKKRPQKAETSTISSQKTRSQLIQSGAKSPVISSAAYSLK